MDDSELPYRLDVSMIARCYNKTPGQLHAALTTLVNEGLLKFSGNWTTQRIAWSFQRKQAIRTLATYANLTDEQIRTELRKFQLIRYRQSGDCVSHITQTRLRRGGGGGW